MAIDPSVLLRGVVPDAVGSASRGFNLGQAIRNAPLLREQKQLQVQAAGQQAQAQDLKRGQNEALVAFQLFGNDPITAETYDQAIALAESQGIVVDEEDRILSDQNISAFNRIIQAGGQLAQASGRGGLASAKTVTYNDGTVLQALPDSTTQVVNRSGQVVTGQARIDALDAAQKSGITQAGLKEFTKAESKAIGEASGAEQVVEITTDIAEKTAAATQRGKAKVRLATEGEIAKSIAINRKAGVTEADDREMLASLESNLPNLNRVVDDLRELSPLVTSTLAGRGFDILSKELGFGVSEGGDARAKYVAIVANEILPLLRITFGSAFTEGEGERLLATLGNVNSTPSQRDDQLDAFIEAKTGQINVMRKKLGIENKLLIKDAGNISELSDEDLFK